MSADTPVDDNVFAGLKKKKKSKKVEFDPEVDVEDAAPVEGKSEDAASAAAAAPSEEAPAEDGENLFGDLKKKKKKKSTGADLLGNDAPEEAAEAPAAETGPDDFSDLKKKKKKSKKVDLEAFERELAEDGPAAAGAGGMAEDGDVDPAVPSYGENELGENVFGEGAGPEEASSGTGEGDADQAWQGSDRDYTYEELLSRAFRILRSQNPELAGDRRRYTIAPPQMVREGTKKTVFANLADICKRMHRADEHVISFLFAELGTTGSVDGNHRLVIKGRYTQKNMENVLRRYIVEYVTCQTCKSPDTLLSKENRIFFMQCQSCGSRRSVAAIKQGFSAQIGRRKATAT